MPLQSNCPACNQQVRVPDQLIGRNVKCPACGHVFLATESGPASAPMQREHVPPPPPNDDYEDSRQDYDDYAEDRPRRRRKRGGSFRKAEASGRLTAPAICLLITGILWLGYAVLNTVVVVAQGGAENAMKDNPLLKGGDDAQQAGFMLGFWGAMLLGPILGILVTAGASCMLARKLRGLAIAGNIAAMIPCSPCCLLGIPFGIWGLVVLLNADVKDAFT